MMIFGSVASPNDSSASSAASSSAASVAADLWRHWSDDDDEQSPWHRFTAAEVAALELQRFIVSPWRVLRSQAVIGIVVALGVAMTFGTLAGWSAIYGAACALLPGALMARGATRMANSRSPIMSALSLLSWGSAKMICSMVMLVLATRVLHPVVWPALLATLTSCLVMYWVALVWRTH